MIPVYTAEQVQCLDRLSEATGMTGGLLMEQAGVLAADRIARLVTIEKIAGVLVVVGPGNNGADGLVVARILAARGIRTEVLITKNAATSELFKRQLEMLKLFQVALVEQIAHKQWLVVDAIFGVGFSRSLDPSIEVILQKINKMKWRVALDVPTGLNATTGEIMGASAFRADWTLTFGFLKTGFFLNEGTSTCGRIEVMPLSYPSVKTGTSAQGRDHTSADDIKGNLSFIYGKSDFLKNFPRRKNFSHKGTFGHCMAMVGWGYAGAALLSLRALQVLGVGYAHWIAPESDSKQQKLSQKVVSSEPQLLVHPIDELSSTLQMATGVLLGSGCDPKAISSHLLQNVCAAKVPTVVDAGALRALVKNKIELTKSSLQNWVLTPHSGEAAELLGVSTDEINRDRLAAAQQLAQTYGCIVVLKGHKTVVTSPLAPLVIIESGGEALAKAGSGDVLAGFIASLITQNIDPFKASCMAAWLHGYIGDCWSQQKFSGSMTPSDIIEMAPVVLKDLLKDKKGLQR